MGQWVTVQRSNWESLSDERRQRLATTSRLGGVCPRRLVGGRISSAPGVRQEERTRLPRRSHTPMPMVIAWDAGSPVNGRATPRDTHPDLRARLQKLPGWEWTPNDTRWEDSFRRLQKYAKKNGHACPPQKYEDTDGYRLGTWVSLQRQLYAKRHSARTSETASKSCQAGSGRRALPCGRKASATFRSTSGRTDTPSRPKAMWITTATR